MNLEKAQKLVAKENGKKSSEARKNKYGKNYSKVMSEMRKGKKLSEIKL